MTTNVRFYRLGVLPSFEVDKHKGIFVHVTGIMGKNNGNPKDPNALLMNTDRHTLVQWLTERRIEKIASGLWFGGENGWELLSNETNSGAINDAIEAKIAALTTGPYAQAEINTTTNSSTLTIKGIKEDNGIIGIPTDGENFDLDIAIDGAYNESTNKIATQSTVTTAVTNAIGGLDSEGTIQAVTTAQAENNNANTVLTFNGIKEVDGKIAQGDGTGTFIVGNANLKIQIGSAEATNVFSANATEDSTIQLDGNVFKKNGDVISVITKSAVASNNKLVTEQDIANLSGAMHYKGSITSDTQWPANENVKAGYVWIASGNFEHVDGSDVETIESGDLIVFNTDNVNSDYTVVQSNITLGTGKGQVAANTEALTNGNLVVATSAGIKTIGITETQLTGDDNNKRDLSYTNGTADGALYHDVTISDAFTVIGKDFTKTINISSANRSIEIAKKTVDGVDTGVMVDLVWNTTMEP